MKSRSWWKTGLIVCLLQAAALVSFEGGALAATDGGSDIPDILKQWKGWVLHGQEAWLCPEVAGRRDLAFCAWPGELKLEVSKQGSGMKFSQSWELQHESAVPLPGDRRYWPQQVTVDGRAHPVLPRDGAPVVWLKKGRYSVSGWIPWVERPQTINIPENVALISLVIDGKSVLPLERHGGALTLGMQEDTSEREGDSLDVQVLRKLTDGIPARLTTRVRLKVSGKAREWSLPDILPAHFVPIRITSPWAARLDTDGRLQVQVMPGQTTIEIEARLDQPLNDVEPVFSPERPQEVWSYEAAPVQRTTVVSHGDNILSVDPRQAGVSADWLSLPAFVVNPGARFQIEERSRGQNEREGQRLTLKRDMWLDFSGEGFFARDRIEGTMRQGWRFDVALPYTLKRADSLAAHALNASDDLSAALLVTDGADKKLTGVEWHQVDVTLNAGVRLAAGASDRIPVTGWQHSFDSVDATLHVPYGYRLIAAPGVDSVSGNVWMERWTIQNIFLAAFFALLAWRLLGAAGGVAAVLYLVLAMHEPFAPMYSFAVVVILGLLCRAVPEGRLNKVLLTGKRVALLFFVGVAVVFASMQIRTALYPQLEEDTADWVAPVGLLERLFASFDDDDRMVAAEAPEDQFPVSPVSPMEEQYPLEVQKAEAVPPPPARARVSKSIASLAGSSAKPGYAPDLRQRYAQSTVTQTGEGEPAWKLGHHYQLRWSGPVTQEQSVRLLVSPPWLTRLLRLLSVALLGWLIWRSIRMAFPCMGARASCGKPRAGKASAVAAMVLCGFVAVGSGFSSSANAQSGGGAIPSDELLEELKTRLLEAPECAPACADVPKVRIDADASQLKVVLAAHVEAPTSLALPEPDEKATLRGARVNGQAWPVLRVNGARYVALTRGTHHVQLDYTFNDDTASLSFPVRPAQVEFGSTHWQVDGIDEGRILGETLNFSRVVTLASPNDRGSGESAASSSSAQQFPPFVRVQRNLVFDLDWNIRTEVTRIAPGEGGFTFPVPLLFGEHVTTAEIKVQDGRALAVFATETSSVGWTARLDQAKKVIELRAPSLAEHAEVWRVTVNPTWHLELDGVPVVLSDGGKELKQALAWRNTVQSEPVMLSSAGEGVVFEFYPLPGEKLTLTLTQPSKTEGETHAIDRVQLENRVGQHASTVSLEFSLRASQGGEHLITLPPELEMLEVRRNGVPLNLQPKENLLSKPDSPEERVYTLSLPVSPGAQTYTLQLRSQGDVGFVTSSPAFDLGLPSANIDVRSVLGENRWILKTSGPAVGPAVLYWGELLVALLLAFLLAKSGISSLKCWQWFLLVLGFSTFSWMTLLIIALWLIVIGWRVKSESCAAWSADRFNAMQLGVAVLTFVMLAGLIGSVSDGLLGVPDMGIRGYGSSGNILAWFADRSDPTLPVVTAYSVPIWVYRALMLAWTLWLANILIRWLKQGFSAWLKGGCWKKTEWKLRKKSSAASEAPPTTGGSPESKGET
ncbi:MAG: hypothetical protein LBE22_08145 [Azoarcus sp.]|nr:hypothetical protein [Azoarcus sp.]